MIVYPGPNLAGWGISPWSWPDRVGYTGRIYGVLHGTSSGGTAQNVFDYFMGNDSLASVTAIVGKQGEVYQCVSPDCAAGGNCCPSNASVNWFPGGNANFWTWSIEIVKNPGNLEWPTEPQMQSVIAVSKWLCQVCGTLPQQADARGGIMSHSFLDPAHRQNNCDPGPFDWARYFRELQGVNYMEKQFDAVWYCVTVARASGIYGVAKAAFLARKMSACFPTSDEIKTNDWGGAPILYQTLSNGYHVEWQSGTGKVYSAQGGQVYP